MDEWLIRLQSLVGLVGILGVAYLLFRCKPDSDETFLAATNMNL